MARRYRVYFSFLAGVILRETLGAATFLRTRFPFPPRRRFVENLARLRWHSWRRHLCGCLGAVAISTLDCTKPNIKRNVPVLVGSGRQAYKGGEEKKGEVGGTWLDKLVLELKRLLSFSSKRRPVVTRASPPSLVHRTQRDGGG